MGSFATSDASLSKKDVKETSNVNTTFSIQGILANCRHNDSDYLMKKHQSEHQKKSNQKSLITPENYKTIDKQVTLDFSKSKSSRDNENTYSSSLKENYGSLRNNTDFFGSVKKKYNSDDISSTSNDLKCDDNKTKSDNLDDDVDPLY